ncbi:hypothetical protein GE061_016273 [Apolygus lucorum]|uniref:Uncharacterized protein n=1 Tax=Apolygus lucorum TaxID=248454 RepID=A0A6A4JUN0_APOLU|nr:hypothetical protein GE061_016273 [Apolygus lucorum]
MDIHESANEMPLVKSTHSLQYPKNAIENKYRIAFGNQLEMEPNETCVGMRVTLRVNITNAMKNCEINGRRIRLSYLVRRKDQQFARLII